MQGIRLVGEGLEVDWENGFVGGCSWCGSGSCKRDGLGGWVDGVIVIGADGGVVKVRTVFVVYFPQVDAL